MDSSDALYSSYSPSSDDGEAPADAISGSLTARDSSEHLYHSEHTKSISHRPKNRLLSAVVSYLCGTIGAGMISLPLALADAGWVGLLLIAVSGLLCVQTANWLVACMTVGKEVLPSYEAIGEAAMGRPGRTLVAIFQTFLLFGACCIFLIIAGDNLSSLIPALSRHAWVLILGVCLIPVSWLKTVKEIKPLAFFGLFSSLFVGLVIVLKGLQTAATSPLPGTQWSAFRADGISSCINIVVFAMGSHCLLPNQANEIHELKTTYRRFTALSYALISAIFAVVAGCGYAGYGSLAQDNILNSIDTPTADHRTHVLALIARLFISLHVLLAYPLPLNPVSLFFEETFGVLRLNQRQQVLPRIGLRTTLVLSSMFVASAVPYLGSILSLVSALSVVVEAFIFPPVFYYLLYRGDKDFGWVEKGKMAVILVVGILSCVVGVYYAITGLVQDIESHPNPFDNFWSE